MARQTALDREKAKVAKLQTEVSGLQHTTDSQANALRERRVELDRNDKEFDRKNQELDRKDKEIKDLQARLAGSLDKGTAEFFMSKISDIVEKILEDC